MGFFKGKLKGNSLGYVAFSMSTYCLENSDSDYILMAWKKMKTVFQKSNTKIIAK